MAAVLPAQAQAHNANHQIRYISRLPETRIASSPFFQSRTRSASTETPRLTAALNDDQASQSWKITVQLRNISSQTQTQSVKVYAWPMFTPEDSQFVASAGTSQAILPGQSGRIDVDVPKRELAEFNERTGKWVLDQGIYMFEIKISEDIGLGSSVVKQVNVNARMEWND